MEIAPPSVHVRAIDEEHLEKTNATVLDRVFAARGVNQGEELDRNLAHLLAPDTLSGILPAANRIVSAILNDELILIIGDYDADGATATALAISLLNALGATSVDFMIPDRFALGYGLSEEIVRLSEDRQPNLIVTVDNGISSNAGVALANQLGFDVIITDHHLPGSQIPPAIAIVNPNIPECEFQSKNLAGVGVIFYVLIKVRELLDKMDWFEKHDRPNIADWLDLVALGTVADVVKLDRNNRILVDQGLKRIRAGKIRPGVQALCEISGKDVVAISSSDLAFSLGPRLNAAGRLDDMTIGVKCLLESNMRSARDYASTLDELNKYRRQIESTMVDDAKLILAGMSPEDFEASGICLYEPSWHQGVVGIVAGRLKDRLYKPVIAFAAAGEGAPNDLKGSARSIPNFHIRDALDAIAASYPGMISKFGGHAMAAGVTIAKSHYERFAKAFSDQVAATISADVLERKVFTDGVLGPAELNVDTARLIASAGPWGQGFPEPLFEGVFEIVSQRRVGGIHLKLVVRKEGLLVDAIAFSQEPIQNCELIRLIYRLQENDYQASGTLQLVVEHIVPLP